MLTRSMEKYSDSSKNIPSKTDDCSDEDEDEDEKANTFRKQNKKPMDPRHTLMDITRDCLERVQHRHIPGLTLSQHNVAPSKLRNYPICKFWAPQPIYVSSAPSHLTDIALSRPLAYDVWHKRLVRLKNNYDKALSARGVNSLEEQDIYNWNLYELAEHINLNPDPYFEGTYDYYYSGGNLALLPMMTSLMPTPLIAHFSTENLYKMRVSKFLPFESNPMLCSIYKQDCELNEVFEVRSLKCFQTNRGNVFAMRQKDKISLNQLLMGEPSSSDDSDSESDEEDNSTIRKTRGDDSKDDLEPGEIKVLNLMEFRSNDVPFTSFAQSASDATTFAISNAKQIIRIYDISLGNSNVKVRFKLTTDDNMNYNILRAWQGEVMIYANSQFICPMDLRTTMDQWKKRVVYGDNGDYNKCNMITALSTSTNLNQLYVATSHKLHCLDVRYMKGYLEGKGSLVSFTHQLRQPPLFITTYAHGDVEFVALGSPQPGDVCICEVSTATHLRGAKPNDANYTAYTLPYQPPTLDEALKSARLSMKCLQPEENIKKRINKCTTGLAFYDMSKWRGRLTKEQHASAYLMIANSVGDVFAQTVSQRTSDTETEQRTNRHTNDIMVKYVKQVVEKNKPPLQYTSIHNMHVLRGIYPNERYSLPKTDYKPIKGRVLRRNQGWRKNMSTLRSYQDYLTEFLLDIWDVEDTNEFDTRLNFDKHIEKEEKGKFVDDWLVKQIPLTEIVEERATSAHQPETQNQKSVPSVEKDLIIEERSIKFEENVLTSTQQTGLFQGEDTFLPDVSEIPNEYQISGIELLDVTELPPRPTMIDDFPVEPIKSEPIDRFSSQLDTTFGNTSNVMVSVPADPSLFLFNTFNFSQQPHSTVEKKRKARKGF